MVKLMNQGRAKLTETLDISAPILMYLVLKARDDFSHLQAGKVFNLISSQVRLLVDDPTPAWSLSSPSPPCRGRRGAELCPEHSDCAAFGSAIRLCHYTKSMGFTSAICSPDWIESVGIT